MRVFVTGGTGFVGSEMVSQLTAAGHTARCLVRPGSEDKLAIREGVEIHLGDVTEPETLERGVKGCQAIIHLVGIIREFPSRGITFERLHVEATRNMTAAAEGQGIRRYLQMSANGTGPSAPTDYHRSKWQAEETVRSSSLDWTIFRPSLIFGPGSEFVAAISGLVRHLPVVPVIGDGQYRLAPVAVADVARSFVKALEMPETVGQTYHCCGPEDYNYDEVVDLVGKALGKDKVCKLHHPLFLMKPAVAVLQNIPRFPITITQMKMLLAGNVCNPGPWAETFDIKPQSFPAGLRKQFNS